jgi:hypothetical protein
MITRQQVIDGVTAFVNRRYNGDWHAAFLAEDANGDELIDRSELSTILSKSGLGTLITRPVISVGVLAAMDTDGDGTISWAEFHNAFVGNQKAFLLPEVIDEDYTFGLCPQCAGRKDQPTAWSEPGGCSQCFGSGRVYFERSGC